MNQQALQDATCGELGPKAKKMKQGALLPIGAKERMARDLKGLMGIHVQHRMFEGIEVGRVERGDGVENEVGGLWME